jgi:hypothetical protein
LLIYTSNYVFSEKIKIVDFRKEVWNLRNFQLKIALFGCFSYLSIRKKQQKVNDYQVEGLRIQRI